MMERRRIVALRRQEGAVALVTLVGAEGSSYRQKGARVLVAASGTHAGTISGGCLESEVIRKASWTIRDGAVVERFSTLFDDTAEVPYGLGCGGVVDLLVEPAGTPEYDALLDALETSLRGEPAVIVTWLPEKSAGKVLKRVVLAKGGQIKFATTGLSVEKIDCARGLVPGRDYEGRFVEELKPPQRLIVLGAGEDAKPLVKMAASLGWNVVVSDGRAALAQSRRFPEAERVLRLVGDSFAIEEIGISKSDAVVLMTHSYEQDRELLAAVLPLSPRYLGLLGARHRSSLLVSEAALKAGLTVAECCARLYAPVG